MRNFLLREIENGGYKLDKMLERIKAAASSGAIDIVNDQPYLERRARENAKVGNEIDIEKTVLDLVARVKALEEKLADTTEPPTDENGELNVADIAEYVPGKWYYAGDVVRWQDEAYVCIAPDGVVCVWSPSAYPAYWEIVN